MFVNWITTGVGWGIMIASAAFTIFVIAMTVLGFLSIGARWLRGGRDETDDATDDNF